jgi:tetratricopeptide (TPR) repeat protein
MREMRILGTRVAATFAACLLGVVTFAQAGRLIAQTAPAAQAAPGSASIHGKVINPAGLPLTPNGEVKLTTEKNPNSPNAKFDYTFPIDGNGEYKGSGIKPGNYTVVALQEGKHVDFMPAQIAAGADQEVNFDMTRKEYIDKMSPADKANLEEYKKNAAATTAQNAKITNLNNLLKSARADTAAGNYDAAAKAMTDATTAKPDEPILWETLGDAQLGQANAAAKVAHDAKTTDATVPDKYAAAETSYEKALTLNAAAAKPNVELTGTANNQLGQALGKTGKVNEAAAAYELAAKADPTKASTYYFNEAATLFNGNDIDGAAAAADKAIAADPTKADAYYIKGQALVQKATVVNNVITAPPECIAAYQKYLELAPTGPHAQEVKDVLAGIGAKVAETYKAPPGAKKTK